MNRPHLLHFLVQAGDRKLPWTLDSPARRVPILKARNLGEAGAMVRAYPLMMIVADLTAWDADARGLLEQLRAQIPEGKSPAMIGLLRFQPTTEQRAELIAAGTDGLMQETDPERFLLWQIEMLSQLNELSQFEKSRMDVAELSHQTRQKLHDLSQPLSALQGRLQLMAAKTSDENPDAKTIRDLVRLIFEVSNQLMEVQRLHRSFS